MLLSGCGLDSFPEGTPAPGPDPRVTPTPSPMSSPYPTPSPTPSPEVAPHEKGCDAFEECEDSTKGTPVKEMSFKETYEALNGTTNSSGKEHRTITIPEENPFTETTPEEVITRTESGKSFWLYIGDPKCPWCRSVIEVAADVAKEHSVDTIYFLNIWDESGNEILRDKFKLTDGSIEKVQDGTPEYARMLELFDEVLKEYTLKDDNGNEVNVGEKRIYAPNFFRIENGKATKMTDGISEKQEDPRGELTEEIIEDEREMFETFFS